jgi:hypothetical protein
MADSEYSIELSDNGKYIRVLVKADVTLDIACRWTQDLVALTNKTGVKNYLFDSRNAKNICSASDNFKFSYEDSSKLKLDKSTRQALLVDPDDHSHDFVETTKVNAGYMVKIFNDETEALKWLES